MIQELGTFTSRHSVIRAVLCAPISIRRIFLKRKLARKVEVLRNLADLLAEDPVVQLPDFGGKFALDVRSDLFARVIIKKEYEPEVVRCCTKYLDRQRDAVDVGANVGFFTVLFAKRLDQERKVLSIEPAENALARLRHNLDLNDLCGKVEVFAGAASDRNGTVEIKTIRGKEEYSSLGVMKHPSISEDEYVVERVLSVTIDELVEEKGLDPGFLRVDVEGAENLVFSGAQKVLRDKRPIVVSELSAYLLRKNGSSAKEVLDLLGKYDYDIFDLRDPSVEVGKKDFGDIVCFPEEMNIAPNRA